MTKPLRTQFVIADGGRARWVTRSERADDFVTVRELKADKVEFAGRAPGAVFESSTSRSSGLGEPGKLAKEQGAVFAAEVAEALNADAERDAYDRLALVAPARILSAISKGLSGPAKARLANSLAKDLTKVPDHELGQWLRPLELG